MNMVEFSKILRDTKLIKAAGGCLTEKVAQQTFACCQQVRKIKAAQGQGSAIKKKITNHLLSQAELGDNESLVAGGVKEMDFSEFQEALCAIANIVMPNPYEPYAHRLQRFLKVDFFPLAKGGQVAKRTRKKTVAKIGKGR
jgi:hypothetical protein